MNKPIILCVDDEPMILTGLKEQVKRTFPNHFEIETAESGEAALEIISSLLEGDRKGELQVIICDQLMPGLKGDEVLIRLSTIFPETRSVLLTGQADLVAIANAVNKANLFRYIAKPWDPNDLMMTIKEACRSFEQDRRIAQQYKEMDKLNESLEISNKNLEAKVDERTNELRKTMSMLNFERQKTEDLLSNMLPVSIANRLKNGERNVADLHKNISVLFADIVNFTFISQNIKPHELVYGLDQIFSMMDSLAKKYKLEKIKTIGDSYFLASGLPIDIVDKEINIVKFALELQKICENNLFKISDFAVNFRIGIHYGDVVAGIIGENKYSYDLWGDTVNIAKRMEEYSEPAKIHISEEFKNVLLKNMNGMDLKFIPRGELEIKGKGKLRSYFLESKTDN